TDVREGPAHAVDGVRGAFPYIGDGAVTGMPRARGARTAPAGAPRRRRVEYGPMTQDTPRHETLMQCFEWYLPSDGSTWRRLAGEAPALAAAGITKAWLPPANKGGGGTGDPGYGVYDLYDLGEFDQKGTVRTKYGTKEEYLAAIRALQAQGIDVLADIVLNQRMGGDARQRVKGHVVDSRDQRKVLPGEVTIEPWTRFDFKGRHGMYSDTTLDWRDFTGTYRNGPHGERQVVLFDGKQWNPNVSDERGNFDYVLGLDTDFGSPRVRDELTRWGRWFVETTGVDGFRLDAVKHIDSTFWKPWLEEMATLGNHPRFAVGEYWGYDAATLRRYLEDVGHSMTVFDVPLHLRFRDASEQRGDYDLRMLFFDTLSVCEPGSAVVFVDNHDTVPGQGLESWVQPWFKPMAYAFILLRDLPYPCVFYGDWYGIPHQGFPALDWLPRMAWIRAHLLGDHVEDLTRDDPHALAWQVKGEHPVIVVMTNADGFVQHVHDPALAGRTFVDLFDPGHVVRADADGRADFDAPRESTAVFLTREDMARVPQA
ncbi:MAG: alpha-amylase, partial [Bifidobacterium sp.]|nr:alpha-amylase [Bifidobacterium sp.]